MAQQFTSDEAAMIAAVKAYEQGSQDVNATLTRMKSTMQELWASNYLGQQRQALESVFNDLAVQTQQVERALGPEGLAGLVNTTWGTYSTSDSDIASSINQVGGNGAVFNRLVG